MNDLDNYKMPWLGKQIARAFVNLARAIKASLPKRDGRITLRGLRVLNWLKRHYIWVLIAIAVFAFGELWFELINRLRLNLFDAVLNSGEAMDAKESPEYLRAYAIVIAATATALIAIATAPFALLKAWVNERLADNAEQSHITERMTKAIEQLGAEKTVYKEGQPTTDPNLEVRLGAIYALERIAQDSERDHIPIMETLCAYIRQNANEGEAEDFISEDHFGDYAKNNSNLGFEKQREALTQWIEQISVLKAPRDDVAAALNVIERRSKVRKTHEVINRFEFRINLERANLQRKDLSFRDLTRANAEYAYLDGSEMFAVDLEHALLFGATMRKVGLSGANLRHADLGTAKMFHSFCVRADFSHANLAGADLRQVDFTDAVMMEANFHGAELAGAMFTGSNVRFGNFKDADLSGTSLFAADLSGADFRAARLRHTDFQFANLSKVNFGQVDLSEVTNISQDQVNSMFGDIETTLPREVWRPDHWSDFPTPDIFSEDAAYEDWIAHGAPLGKPVAGST